MTDETQSSNHIAIVKFTLLRETKGANLYQEIDASGNHLKGDPDGAVIGSLYLRKAALSKLGKGTPKSLSLHIDI